MDRDVFKKQKMKMLNKRGELPEKEQRIQNVTYLCLTVSDKVIDTINPKKKIKKENS